MKGIPTFNETIEEIFIKVGYPQTRIFKKDGQLTKLALTKYYDKAMRYTQKKYNINEDQFDFLCNGLCC